MWMHGGIRDYYRGLTLGLLGIIPYSAIDLGCFEAMKRAYRKAVMKKRDCSYEDAEPSNPQQLTVLTVVGNIAILCMGAISGSIGASAVFPINLLVFCHFTAINVSAPDYRHKEQLCYHMSMMV
jgi:solute carrier family 25 (mitochondrial phosphate transporter), member 23/24/25/41